MKISWQAEGLSFSSDICLVFCLGYLRCFTACREQSRSCWPVTLLQLIKLLTSFYVVWNFVTFFIKVFQSLRGCATWIQSTAAHSFFYRFILVLSSHIRPDFADKERPGVVQNHFIPLSVLLQALWINVLDKLCKHINMFT